MARGAEMHGDAYRVSLYREWAPGPSCLWIALNPSTADGLEDDPTVRRMIGFTRRWSTWLPGSSRATAFGRMDLGNLYGLRATDPRELRRAADPIGPVTDDVLGELVARAALVVAAWGSDKSATPERVAAVKAIIRKRRGPGVRVIALGLTKSGAPKHPLYLPGDASPIPFPID